MTISRLFVMCIAVGGVTLGAGVSADATVVFQDNFESTTFVPGVPDTPQVGSYPVEPQVDPEADVIFAGTGIDPASPDAGQNILKIVGKQRNYGDPATVANTGDTITYEFDANHSFSEFTFGFMGDQGGVSLDLNLLPVWLRVTETDTFYYNSGWVSTGLTPTLDTWEHYSLTYTVGDSTFDLNIGGNSATGLALTTATAPTVIDRVKIMSGGASNTLSYLDNPTVSIDSAGGLLGDLDGDGFVGISDLNIILANWNQSTPIDDPRADVTGEGDVPDGFVGINDLNVVLGNWNAGTPPGDAAAVPEPATLGLVGMGLVLLGRRTS